MWKIHGLEDLVILRVLALFSVLVISSLAHAQSSFGTFVWERDGDFTLQFIYNGKAAELKGNLREDPPGVPVETQVVGENGFTVNVKAFPEGTAYAVVSEQFDDQAMIFFMQRQVGFYSPYNTEPIMTFKVSGVSDANGILEILEKTQGWDSAQAMLSTAKYFAQNPTVKLNPYRNSVESGEVMPPDPTPTVAPSVVDGVVEMPDKVARPPKLDIEEQPATEQPSDDDQIVPDAPLDLSGGDFLTPPEETVRPPKEDGGFVPMDMTDGWDGDEDVE